MKKYNETDFSFLSDKDFKAIQKRMKTIQMFYSLKSIKEQAKPCREGNHKAIFAKYCLDKKIGNFF